MIRNRLSFASVIVFALTNTALADHGPGTSGSGFSTLTAETLKPGRFSSTLQTDWTEFENLSGDIDEVDLLDRSFLTTLSVGYGVVENFQVGITFGYYAAEGNRELENGDFVTFDPDGFADMWLTGKYRFYQGPSGQVAFIGGLKAPVGDSRLMNSEGERVEPSATAGTGAWDLMTGFAYTYALNSDLTLDASALYIFRGERYDYELGDRLDLGTSLAWRLCGDAQTFPQISVVGELTLRHIGKSEESGEKDSNTGGTAVFFSPGVKVSFSPQMAASLGVQFPVSQDLNGRQVETDFRMIGGVTYAF